MRTIANIRDKIANLETKTTDSFGEVCQLYQYYLNQLEQGVSQQLVTAVHHIVTQIYPETFLSLKFSQRQKFQEKLRQISREFQPKLKAILATKGIHVEIPNSSILANTEQEDSESSQENANEEINPSENSDNSEALSNGDNSENITVLSLDELLPQTTTVLNVKNPEDLSYWCRGIEQGIQFILDLLSQETNSLLQAIGIINQKLPTKILEMALQAEDNGMNIGRTGVPNLLNLVVEARQERKPSESDSASDKDENEEEADNTQVMKIVAIHLRLSEIEFADAQLSMTRQQLQKLDEQINKLRKQYHSLKQDLLRSEAEAAWRASWMEEKS